MTPKYPAGAGSTLVCVAGRAPGFGRGPRLPIGRGALIRDADAAMYRAKEMGRARYEIFDQQMRFRLAERLRIENELRAGIDHGEPVVHYQPVVSLVTGEVAGAEALVRWRHPERGALLPGEFIDVAEESGLIRPLGRWVLEEACRQTAEWQNAAPDAAPIGIAVNVSAVQLSDHAFPHLVRQTLESAGSSRSRSASS
jgi:predicted signal transduction protein with EAL and GGDEF domain